MLKCIQHDRKKKREKYQFTWSQRYILRQKEEEERNRLNKAKHTWP